MPVYASHLAEYDALSIGQRIHDERKRMGVTMQDLKRRCGISTAKLSRIVNGHDVLDLQQALAIATALGLHVRAFLPEDTNLPFQISRDAELRTRAPRAMALVSADGTPVRKHQSQFWPLADLFVGRHTEPVLARILPATDEKPPPLYYRDREEFFFVLNGTIEFFVRTLNGLQREELHRGDCVSFNSTLPHCLQSVGAAPAESVHVFAHGTETGAWVDSLTSHQAFVAEEDSENARTPMGMTGRKLRTFRESLRLPPARVAQSVGLTVARIQQIERGERPLPIDAMLRIARAFGRPIRDFTTESVLNGPPYFIQRCADLNSVPARLRRRGLEQPNATATNVFLPLSTGFPADHMYPYLVKVPNAEVGERSPHQHDGEEFIYLLDGEIVLTTYSEGGEISETLRPGDSCYLDSNTPHVLRGQTRNPYADTSAEVIVVFWSPRGEEYLFEPPVTEPEKPAARFAQNQSAKTIS